MARQSLSKERIIETALNLIEIAGLSSFSIRKLGKMLRCEAMSIYHYFPSKEHILDGIVDFLLVSISHPPESLTPEDRIKEYCRAFRRLGLAHPHFFQYLAVHRLNSPVGINLLNQMVKSFLALGLGVEKSARAFRILSYYVMGATLDETAGYAHGPSSMNPVPNEVIERHFPELASASAYFPTAEHERTFEQGLDLFLKSLVFVKKK